MSQRFAVVYEAEADFDTATALADRVLVEAIEWLENDLLPNQREWLAEAASGRQLTWVGIKKLASAVNIRIHGHFDGQPGLADAAAARRAILFLRQWSSDLAAVVLVRDQDDQPERRAGLEQARNQERSGLPIVLGFAVVEREAWVVSGFEPKDEREVAAVAAESRALGFDPRLRSHDLTAGKDDTAVRSPKRVLRVLAGDDRERERRCWRETPLPLLRERGAENGLADYLREVRERLAPLLGHVAQSRPTH